ncbi:protein FANTASTIC FOUR 1 [Syzygium oleosum]|uniref:protein FANTASTIC FOUR 1 n=1 Tax=Syzygium oleosum TaxID=219896 RepID=UPI0024B8A111|nr:protein FANTASTIC FOUR 1 [Syzygium oleosum]
MTALRLKLVTPKTTTNHSFPHSLLDLASSSPPHCNPLNTTPQQLLEDPKHTHHHHHHQHHPISSSPSNPSMGLGVGGWSFLHPLSTNKYQEPSEPDQEPPVYVHPLARASSLRLSPLSLELCTENLGSESSNIVTFDDDDGDGDPRDESKSAKREQTAPRPWSTRQIMNVENATKKAKPGTNINDSNSNSFPPPLTTMANDSIRVRPHREEGRLILEAVRAPQGNRSCFHAERSHGRLRLCLFKDRSPLCFDSEEQDDRVDVEARTDGDAENETAENDVAEEEEEEEEEEVGGELSLVDEQEEEEKEEAEQDSDGDDWEEEGMEGTHESVGGKSGMEMLQHHHRQRPTCCKEGGGNEHGSRKRLLYCKAFLVAT